MEQMKEFITAVQTDAAFDQEIHSLLGEGKIAELLEAATQKGFSITESDLREHLENKGAGNELPEEALENIAGGSRSDNSDGTAYKPYTSETCWFLSGLFNKSKCARLSCKGKTFVDSTGRGPWYQCCCWGTSNCIDKIHHKDHACE